MTMKNAEIVTKVKQALLFSVGFENDDESTDRQHALDRYLMRPRGDEVSGRSQVQGGTISAMVEAVLSFMTEAFSSTRIVSFDSMGKSDDRQAQLESDAVEFHIMKRGRGKLTFMKNCKDALLLRNCLNKVWVEEKETVNTRELQGVQPIALGELTNVPGAEVDLLQYDEKNETATIRIKTKRKVLRIEPTDPTNFVYTDGWHSHDLQDIPLCGERMVTTRSEAIDVYGLPKSKVNKLTAYRKDYKSDKSARKPKSLERDRSPLDSSQELIEWYYLFVLMDMDGDGISERYLICIDYKGTTLLKKERRNLVEYAAGAAILMPHEFRGLSLVDKLDQQETLDTGLLRAFFDNANANTKNRLLYLEGKLDPTALEDGRVNSDVGVTGVDDVRKAAAPVPVNDLTGGLLSMIQDQRVRRAEIGGASLEMASGNMQLNDRLGSEGLDRAYSAKEQLAAMFTSTIAETIIVNTYLLAHATMREEFTGPVAYKQDGAWQDARPSKWIARESATVRIGMSPGERARKAATLRFNLEMQMGLAREGQTGILVDPNGFYAALMDFNRVSDMPMPERYYIDPTTPEAQQKAEENRQAAQQESELSTALMRQAVQLEGIEKALTKYMHDSELQFKYFDRTLDSEEKEAEIVGGVTGDLIKKQMEGDERDDGNGGDKSDANGAGAASPPTGE